MLGRMKLPFSLGLGGPLGDGRQWMSWIGIDDAAAALFHALVSPSVTGPMNVVAPEPVRNAEFTRVLGRVLRRPALVPVPAFALRIAVGDLADEGLLASARVRPGVLESSGFVYREPDLEGALRHLLGRPAR
jgi:NAD dependent epimerase/dehydratase family enzyme